MIDTLRSYLDKEEYYIIIMNDKTYIKNYTKLIGINEHEILITIHDKTLHLEGTNLYLTQSSNNELIIKGSIESINNI